jgi:hypothetical protein
MVWMGTGAVGVNADSESIGSVINSGERSSPVCGTSLRGKLSPGVTSAAVFRPNK